jgi:hypothetical protein
MSAFPRRSCGHVNTRSPVRRQREVGVEVPICFCDPPQSVLNAHDAATMRGQVDTRAGRSHLTPTPPSREGGLV